MLGGCSLTPVCLCVLPVTTLLSDCHSFTNVRLLASQRCRETVTLLQRSVRDFEQLIDRIEQQRLFEAMDHAASISWEVRKPISFPVPKEKEREDKEKDKKEVSDMVGLITYSLHLV